MVRWSAGWGLRNYTSAPPGVSLKQDQSFYFWKIKLFYLFLHLLIQILSQNHNCNVLNGFFIVLSHNNARSENGQSIIFRQFLAQNQVCMLNHPPYSPHGEKCLVAPTSVSRHTERNYLIGTLKLWYTMVHVYKTHVRREILINISSNTSKFNIFHK